MVGAVVVGLVVVGAVVVEADEVEGVELLVAEELGAVEIEEAGPVGLVVAGEPPMRLAIGLPPPCAR